MGREKGREVKGRGKVSNMCVMGGKKEGVDEESFRPTDIWQVSPELSIRTIWR